jgi:hypothetical protein
MPSMPELSSGRVILCHFRGINETVMYATEEKLHWPPPT